MIRYPEKECYRIAKLANIIYLNSEGTPEDIKEFHIRTCKRSYVRFIKEMLKNGYTLNYRYDTLENGDTNYNKKIGEIRTYMDFTNYEDILEEDWVSEAN